MDNFQGPYLEINKFSNELISNESFRNLRPEIRKELIDSCHEVMATTIPKKYARHIQDCFYDLSILPVADENGTITAAVASGFTRAYNKVFPLFQDLILDNIPIVLFYAEYSHGEYFFRAVNRAFLDTTGLRMNQVVGKKVKDVIPAPSHELVFSHYKKAKEEKRIVHWEEKSSFPNGVKYGQVSVIPVYDDSGEFSGLIGTVHDITDTKNTEIELQKNFTLLNAIVEGTTDAVFIKDLKGRYIMINSSTSHFHGRPKEEMIGRSDFDLLSDKEVAQLYSENDREVIRTNRAKTFLEEGTLGGRYQCFLSQKAPYKDPDGNIIGVIGLSRDITELKESQKALEKSQKEIKSYAEKLKMLSDLSVSFSKAQLNLEKICDIIVKEASNTFHSGAILELLNEDGVLEIKCLHHIDDKILEKMKNERPQFEEDYAILRKEKPLLKVAAEGFEDFYIIPLWALEKPLGVLKIAGRGKEYARSDLDYLRTFSDRSALAISNATLFKKANEAIQLREDFIQVASHELRTPLTPLKLQIGLLQRFLSKHNLFKSTEGQALSRLFQGADQQVMRLKNLIDDLIDVTKFSTDRLNLVLKKKDLLNIIRLTVLEFEKLNPEAKIQLNLPDEKEIIGNVDEERIKQALKKLLSNGLQFGLQKPLAVSAQKIDDSIRIRIQDFGLGIPEEDQKRIFERFERGMPVNSYGGLGMGLYITRKIIDAHGGKISIESELKKGSIFTLDIPLGHNPGEKEIKNFG